MSGYFTEVEILRGEITKLQTQIEQERNEHKEIYMALKKENILLKEQLEKPLYYNDGNIFSKNINSYIYQ